MGKIGLSDAVALIRKELRVAMAATDGSDLQFTVGQITLNFQVGITQSGTGSAGVQLWVLELGAEGTYARETIQGVTIVLDPPTASDGKKIKIAAETDTFPR